MWDFQVLSQNLGPLPPSLKALVTILPPLIAVWSLALIATICHRLPLVKSSPNSPQLCPCPPSASRLTLPGWSPSSQDWGPFTAQPGPISLSHPTPHFYQLVLSAARLDYSPPLEHATENCRSPCWPYIRQERGAIFWEGRGMGCLFDV